MTEERIQKLLAQAGIGSRRACEELIAAGRVTVDGRVVTELGTKVDAQVADVRVDGEPIARQHHRYVMLHKPVGYLSGPDARAGYPSWVDLVKVPERLYAVGRLDVDSEGLLLLTNDGELAQQLTHPSHEHPKTYLVQVQGTPNPRKIRRLQHGVMLDDGRTAPAQVELIRQLPFEDWPRGAPYRRGSAPESRGSVHLAGDTSGDENAATRAHLRSSASPSRARGTAEDGGQARARPTSWLKITIHEGRKRQVRRMVGLLGHPALRVIRVGLGPLMLGDLRPGKWRDLTPEEVAALRALIQSPRASRSKTPEPGDTGKRDAMPSTIAIDGPAASGKSTIGGQLAQALGYLYLDTGVMYRAVTAVALARGVSIDDEAAVTALAEQVKLEVLPPTVADGRDVTVLADGTDITWDIRKPEVERAVSPVSAYAGVREALVAQQRRIGQAGRVVMVGRDIGTVVLPDADLKIYLDASVQARAYRRYLERVRRGEPADLEQVLAEMKRRDHIDSSRQHSPLSAAPDAIVVDSTELTVEQVLARVLSLVKRRKAPRRGRQKPGAR